ncbi:uncharacterized protein LOC135125753 [Zophobas morio]|uniref:uncharacterized protein LOC135125753 n=1 Tax=Zophobas morio TaxID=2755281 RepID=UPI00308282C1
MEKDDDNFTVRPGTIDRGKDYEVFNIANIILNLLSDDNLKDFKIASNAAGFGDFDDIVLEVEYEDGSKEEYLVQLKHVQQDNKMLVLDSLVKDNGKYSIKKYFNSYRKDIKPKNNNSKMVFYTNLKLNEVDFKIPFQTSNVEISPIEEENKWLVTSAEKKPVRFVIEKPSDVDELYEEFFNNFLLYTNQANTKQIRNDLSEKFCRLFNCEQDACEKYIQFVSEWSKKEGKKQKLTKLWIRQVIAACLLSQYINPVSNIKVKDKYLPLTQAMDKFHLTAFPAEETNKVAEIWEHSEDYTDCLRDFNIMRQKFHLKMQNITKRNLSKLPDKSLLLWLGNKCPLVIFENPTTTAAIKLYPEGKYIVMENDDVSSEFKQKLKDRYVFRCLSDLDRESEDYENLVEKISCNLQGRKISLKALLDQHEELTSAITTNELLQMLETEVFSIGEDTEELPNPHIERNLSTTVIDVKFLKQIQKYDSKIVVVISCNGKKEKIQTYLENFELIKVENYISSNMKLSNDSKIVFYTDKECSQEDFDIICHKNKAIKDCHHFRITDEGHLEWIKSKNNIEELEPFLGSDGSISESEIYNLPPGNNINVICANPGIGKSVLTKSLKNKLSTRYWILIINPTDVSAFFRHKQSITFDNYIETKMLEKYKNFDKTVMSAFKKKNMISYIWDGLDEISDENLKKVLDAIDALSKKNVLQWITSRCHLQDKLEKRFNVFSRTIQQFDDKQQEHYIRERLQNACNEECVKKIRDNIEIIHCQEALAIPLQIYMLTELFLRDPEKYQKLLTDTFSLADLYHHFVNEKFNNFYKEKANIEEPNDSLRQILLTYKESYIKKYEKAAVALLNESNLQVDCDKFLTKIKEERDAFGLIVDVSDNMQPIFVHNSYGEYFIACYFFKNYGKVANLKNILFKERYTNIRFLFDLLMAKDSEVHVAVLYKNLDVLKKNEESLKRKDRAGRNALQVACTWGQRYPLLITTAVEEEADTYQINEKLGDSVEEENSNYQEIINYLSDKCDLEEKDKLFQMDCAQYADTAMCLFPISQIAPKKKLDINSLSNFKDLGSLLYYGIKLDYVHILDLVADIPLIKTEKRSLTLIHLCAEFDSIHCLQKLLEIEKYKQIINNVDIFDVSAASIACKKGRLEILEALIEAGAELRSNVFQLIQLACKGGHHEIVHLLLHYDNISINEDRKSITAALQTACLSGYDKIVQILVDFGADVNVNTRYGTPLYVACTYGHKEVVEILLRTKRVQLNKGNKYGCTPLHIACQRNYVDVVKLLLLTSAVDVNVADNKGLTPIHIVTKNGNEELLQLLIASKADVNKANKKKITALHISCQCGKEKIAKMLIDADAQVNSTCSEGCTPIFMACEHGDRNIVKLLLASDANIALADKKNVLPQAIAEQKGFDDIKRLLDDFIAEKNFILGGKKTT